MRYRLAALMLLAVLPLMNVLAAPAPEPYAILDIGPPPKGWSMEKHCKTAIHGQTCHGTLSVVSCYADVGKLPSVAPFKDARPWLAENLRITEEEGGRRLRLTFRAGTRDEQVTILNALLRANLQARAEYVKFREEGLRSHENCVLELEKRIESGQQPNMVDTYQKGIDELRSIRIPECRAEITRLKQFAVIKWAK